MSELFSHKLRQRFFIRIHLTLIFAAVIGSGVVGNRVLRLAGFDDMRGRYPLVVVLSYLVFFALTRLWLVYLASHYRAGEIVTVEDDTRERSRGSWDWLTELVDPCWFEGEGFVATMVFVIVVGILIGVAVYFVAEAPLILMEAAFQMFLSAGLVRSARRAERLGWGGVLFRRSVWALIAVTALAFLSGWLVHDACPRATRLHEALHCSELTSPERLPPSGG